MFKYRIPKAPFNNYKAYNYKRATKTASRKWSYFGSRRPNCQRNLGSNGTPKQRWVGRKHWKSQCTTCRSPFSSFGRSFGYSELEISNHLQQMDWTDWELSNQIANLQKDCITSKRGGFWLTSGHPEGSGGSSGNGGSGGRGFGGSSSGGQPPSFGPDSDPAFSLGRWLFYGSMGIICYLTYQWAKGKIREELANLLLEWVPAGTERARNGQPDAPRATFGGGPPKKPISPKNYSVHRWDLFWPQHFYFSFKVVHAFLAHPSKGPRTQLALKDSVGRAFFPCGSGRFADCLNIKFWSTLVWNEWSNWLVCASRTADIGLGGRFFLCPRGGNIVMICMEKQVKIWACTFWFGAFSVRLAAVYRKNKLIFWSLAIFAVGFFAFILKDHTYCPRAASQIRAQPFAGRLLESQFGPFGCLLLLFGGIFFKFTEFSIWTFGLDLICIYCSQIHKNILILPLLPRDGETAMSAQPPRLGIAKRTGSGLISDWAIMWNQYSSIKWESQERRTGLLCKQKKIR